MRPTGLMIVAALVVSIPAAAAWKEYPQPQLGFVVEFPSDPAVSTSNYKTTLVPSATAYIYSVKEDHALYVASVIDLLDRKEEGATLLGEAESLITQLGDVTSMSTSRVEPGRAAIYGRFITIDCRSGRVPDGLGQTADTIRAWFKSTSGVECPDKSRLMVNMFFNRGRLYLIQGINLPSTEDASASPAALRFSNSISFFAADGTRNFADTFR
ncbi:MAG TPA: hypothetical protein VE422_03235 [Terriglobia bacterium]|nr:hypothetical protein [Terriglobia bacterium]